MLLVLVVLGVLGALISEYSRVARVSDQQDRVLRSHAALLDLQSLVAQSTSVVAPAAGASGIFLEVLRVDPARNGLDFVAGDRLPSPTPSPLPPSWDPLDPADLASVRCEVVDGDLVQQITAGGVHSQVVLCAQVSGFSCDHLASGEIVMRLSCEVNQQIKTSQLRAHRWLP